MKQLLHLLKWDLMLLQRNQLVAISLLIAGLYLGVFFLLKSLGNLENVLILMIFNDPIITGYLFGGVLLLFEKDQHTLAALSVSPLSFKYYLWSKAIALTLIATLTALIMVWTAYGLVFNYLHFIASVAGSTLFFVWLGCGIGVKARGFNHFLIQTIAVLILVAVPFLALFGVWQSSLFFIFPSYPGLLLLQASFKSLAVWQYIYSYTYLLLCLVVVFFWCKNKFNHV